MRLLVKCIIILWVNMSIAQTPYVITVNTPEAYQQNLFFFKGGDQPRSVMILSPEGEELFVESWGMKGWDFKVNENNLLTYYDRYSDGWFVMDSLKQEVDSVYCLNGLTADNHDFIALPNGNYVLFAYDLQPYAMDTVVEGGDPNALIEWEQHFCLVNSPKQVTPLQVHHHFLFLSLKPQSTKPSWLLLLSIAQELLHSALEFRRLCVSVI